jgi:uncharacterized protein
MSDFGPIKLEHKQVFDRCFSRDWPQTSELTFTNLYMWRFRYRPIWTQWQDNLLVIMQPSGEAPFGLPPVGPGDKQQAMKALYSELERLSPEPRLARVPEDFVRQYVTTGSYTVREDPDNHDYVYLARELIELSGRKFHAKKNHLNRFVKTHRFEYRKLDAELVECFLRMQENWCELKDCVENSELYEEDRAVYEALTSVDELGFTGGAIVIDSKVEAFSLGELLNPDTAVIHIEKANPDISGLYAAINQQFCEDAWQGVTYVNREQDLGIEGLKKAKQSYQPHHLVKKFIVS